MQRRGNGAGINHALLQMKNTATVQHVKLPQQILICIFIASFRRDQVQLHPREQNGIANPHDGRKHMHKAKDDTKPASDFIFHE